MTLLSSSIVVVVVVVVVGGGGGIYTYMFVEWNLLIFNN